MGRARRSTGLAAVAALAVSLLGVAPAAQAVDAVDGALTANDPIFPNQGNGGYDALHYDLDLTVDVTAAIAPATIGSTAIRNATTVMQARTTGAPLRSFGMDLQGLEVSSVRVDGRRADFRRIQNTSVTDVSQDIHKLVITPTAPVDGAFTVTVAYAGTPVSHTDADGSSEGWNNTTDGATFLNQPVGAMTGFPHNNTPSDKATYTIGVNVPTTITNAAGTGTAAAVSNGELVSRTPNADGSRTTWVWNQREQMASELSLISIGKYDVLTSEVTLGEGRVVPEWSFVDSALPAASKATINTRRAATPGILRGLETIYGPYPGNSVGLVVDTVPDRINYALETQDRSFFPTVNSVAGNTLIHELVHQWFGNDVAPRAWNDIWINEGMGTWGPSNYNATVAGTAVPTEATYYNSWNNGTAADFSVAPTSFPADELYEYQTYTRGAQMYEALKGSIGDDAFYRFIAAWNARYGGQSHGRADFEALAEEISGRDLTAFFVDWLDEADKPAWVQRFRPSVSTDTATARPGDTVTYTLRAANVGRIPLTSSALSLDLSGVLGDAQLPAALPAGLTRSGSTLTWAIPETATLATARVSFPVVVDADTSQASLSATLTPTTLGGVCTTGCASSVALPSTAAPTAGTTTPGTTTVAGAAGSGVLVVRGSGRVGTVLRVRGLAPASGAGVTYTWKVAGKTVQSSTRPRLRLRAGWVGRRVKVVATLAGPGLRTVRETRVVGRVKRR